IRRLIRSAGPMVVAALAQVAEPAAEEVEQVAAPARVAAVLQAEAAEVEAERLQAAQAGPEANQVAAGPPGQAARAGVVERRGIPAVGPRAEEAAILTTAVSTIPTTIRTISRAQSSLSFLLPSQPISRCWQRSPREPAAFPSSTPTIS